MREKLASRLGFILLSAGCAIGLGNVWRFPYIAGKNGGGGFLVLYLICLALVGLPILVMEFAVGRASGRSLISAHATLTPEKRGWRVHGVAGAIGNFVLMMFYTTVTGWMLIYFCKFLNGTFTPLSPEGIGGEFSAMLASPGVMTVAMLAVAAFSAAVCLGGLQRGVERMTKYLMLALLVLIVILAANSVRLDAADGDAEGLRFFLVPDLARMRAAGFVNVLVEAMNQAFFTLSLGIGAMTIFGSYIGRERSLAGEALHVAALDTAVAVAAGIIIIPACFAYNIDPWQGPGLVFVTLPNVFNHMPLGRLWGALFFAFMSCAALTTVIAVFECIIASLMDALGWTRRRAAVFAGIGSAIAGLPCVLGFNLWSAFTPLGAGSCVLDLEDFIVSDLMLPLGGVAFTIYCATRYGWGWKGFIAEAEEGRGLRLPGNRLCRIYCACILPLVVFSLFALGIYNRFR